MGWMICLLCLLALVQVLGVDASTYTNDFVALKALTDGWTNVPPNWNDADPCGSGWDGISCTDDRVVSITLASIDLSGELASDIEKLSALQILDLSYNKGITGELPSSIGNLNNLSNLIVVGCGFTGSIPPTIGSLQKLVFLSLNSNNFIGEIPASLGNLSSLFWLDLADNKLTGSIPVSKGSSPGLDMLVNARHFHFGKNQLDGEIPSQLFSSNLKLKHLLLEDNMLTGGIPSTLGLVESLEVLRLDMNMLKGAVPDNLNNLTSVQELYLANNKLTGPLPNLTGMSLLNYVDLSNNSFDATDVPPWFSSLQSLTSLIMENTHIKGQLPVSFFSLAQLQTVVLRKNQINGTLNIGSSSNQLQLIDLQNNFIDAFTQRAGYTVEIILLGNPICDEGIAEDYCTIPRSNNSYTTPKENCTRFQCSSDQISSPTCKCAYPYSGSLIFRATSFSNFGNKSHYEILEQELMESFNSHGQPVDSVSISNPLKNADNYLVLDLEIFPSNQSYFNYSGIVKIGFILSNQTFKPPHEFVNRANINRQISSKLNTSIAPAMATAAMSVHQFMPNSYNSQPCGGFRRPKRASHGVVRCCEAAVEVAEKRKAVVKNGNDSLEICRVLNGMWQTSGGWGRIDRDDAVEAMLRYADAGLSTFDMADHYGPAEDLYGIFINRVRRERPPEYLENVRGLTKWVPPPVKMTSSYVRDSINVSRKRMDVAALDMLQFHWWDYSNPGYLDALKHLTDLKEEGKIKTVALTNFDTKRLQIILENDIPIVSNQVQHSLVDMRPQKQMAELCKLTGVKLITYGTVMGGLLSEKFLDTNLTIPFAGPPLNTPSLQKYKRMVDAWGGWSLFQTLLQTLKRVASKHGVSIPAVAVRYILDQPGVAGSMVGVRLGLAEHIKDNNAVFSLDLDEEDVASILEVTTKGKDLMKIIGDCGDEYRRV